MKYAPVCKTTGLNPYVRTTYSWGRNSSEIRYASTLKDARQQFGWTRMRHTSIRVRRATLDDLGLDYGWCSCAFDMDCEAAS